MNNDMELRRRTWIAALKLALVISTAAAFLAVGAYSMGDVPPLALVLPVVIVAFTASWVQTGRVRREGFADTPVMRPGPGAIPTA